MNKIHTCGTDGGSRVCHKIFVCKERYTRQVCAHVKIAATKVCPRVCNAITTLDYNFSFITRPFAYRVSVHLHLIQNRSSRCIGP